MFKSTTVLWKILPGYFTTCIFKNVLYQFPLRVMKKMLHIIPTEYLLGKKVTEIKAANKKHKLFITLIGVDGKVSTSTLEAASKLSKSRNLKLINVKDYDPRSHNPVYRLLSKSQILKEDIQRKKSCKVKDNCLKSGKIISFSYKISDHDTESKVKQIIKWLERTHEVRVTIIGSPGFSLEALYEKIMSLLDNNGKILQKRNSDYNVKFTIVPLREGE